MMHNPNPRTEPIKGQENTGPATRHEHAQAARGHEYNERGFCKYCGWERNYVERTERVCSGPSKEQPGTEPESEEQHLTREQPVTAVRSDLSTTNSKQNTGCGAVGVVVICIGALLVVGKIVQEAVTRHAEGKARQERSEGRAKAWREAGRQAEMERAKKLETERRAAVEFGKKYYAEHQLRPGMVFDTNAGNIQIDREKLEVGATFRQRGTWYYDTYVVRSNALRGRYYEKIDPDTGKPPGELDPYAKSIVDRNKAYKELQKADKALGLTNGLDRIFVP
jgi:hypothetical protein